MDYAIYEYTNHPDTGEYVCHLYSKPGLTKVEAQVTADNLKQQDNYQDTVVMVLPVEPMPEV